MCTQTRLGGSLIHEKSFRSEMQCLRGVRCARKRLASCCNFFLCWPSSFNLKGSSSIKRASLIGSDRTESAPNCVCAQLHITHTRAQREQQHRVCETTATDGGARTALQALCGTRAECRVRLLFYRPSSCCCTRAHKRRPLLARVQYKTGSTAGESAHTEPRARESAHTLRCLGRDAQQ
jgi:hypothetical protein